MDRAGRLVIPREIRREAGLKPGVPLEVRWRGGRIEIEPVPVRVRLARRGRLLVAIPAEPVEPLTGAVVEETRDAVRRERARGG